jgi:2-dehydropantoate 2-reductase
MTIRQLLRGKAGKVWRSEMEDLRDTPITIVGAGAIGGTIGAYLGDAGYDVTLVDVVPEHARAISERGLRITGARGEHIYRPRAILGDELKGPLKVVFLHLPKHETAWAAVLGPADRGYP